MLKEKRKRSRKHLDWLRSLYCYKCGALPESEPCHIRKYGDGGTAMKPGDDKAIPMCHACHAESHRIGEMSFFGGEDGVRKAIKYALQLWRASEICGRVK